MSDMVNVVICDGKYAIIQDESGSTNVLRYGEGWRNVTGDNVILGAAYEIDKLREYIKKLEEELMEVRNKYAVLVADVVLHDDQVERIKQLEEFVGRFLNPSDLGWSIGKFERDEVREALGLERVESKSK